MPYKLNMFLDDIICNLSHWKNGEEFKEMRNTDGDYSLRGFDRLECIYIHIPKAAGISINRALFGNKGGGHKSVHAYKRIFGPATYKKYYTFTFVRNPYSRLLSAYQFLKSGGINENDRIWASRNLSEYGSFNEFVREWLNDENIWRYIHFKPQHSFICDISLIPEVDFVGKVETIHDDFNQVCKVLNVPNNLSVQNKSGLDPSSWGHFYSPYSIEKVADIYRQDFEIFNYPAGPGGIDD